MYIGTSGYFFPLIVHHNPGHPSKKPGRRPIRYSNLRSGWSASSPVAAGAPYESRSTSEGPSGSAGTGAPAGPITSDAPPASSRSADPSDGTVASRSTRPPAGSRNAAFSTGVGPFRSRPSTATTRYGAPTRPA